MVIKEPIRSCVCCRSRKPKIELIRVIGLDSGNIEIDCSQKKNGRGAYVCKDEKCIKSKKLKSNIERALKVQNLNFDNILKSLSKEAGLGDKIK